MEILFIGGLRGWQLIIVVMVIFVLFGGVKKIPEFMRTLGKGVHSFKQGLEDAKQEINKPIDRASDTKPTDTATDATDAPKTTNTPDK